MSEATIEVPKQDLVKRLMSEGAELASALVGQVPASYVKTAIHPTTLKRWIRIGIKLPNGKRVKLESFRKSNRYYTSLPALERFFARQTAACEEAESPATAEPIETPKRRESAAKKDVEDVRRNHRLA